MGLFTIVWWILFGAVVGGVARWVYPGKQDISFWGTVLLGVSGSFVGGMINWMLGWGDRMISGSGFVMSLVGALMACYVYVNQDKIKNWINSKIGN